MNISVDVLAVMDDASEVLLDERMGSTASRIGLARASVAELIEACCYLKRDATNEQWAEFHRALSCVRGDK